MYEIWGSWKDDRLTAPEKELLVKAESEGGEFFVLSFAQTGEFVKVGNDGYLDEADPAIRVRALEAVERLFRRGLVRHEGGSRFCLSGSGFDIARKVKSE